MALHVGELTQPHQAALGGLAGAVAEDEALGVAAAGAVVPAEGAAAGVGLAASELLPASAVAAGLALPSAALSDGAPLAPPRKSVTYQPEPLS